MPLPVREDQARRYEELLERISQRIDTPEERRAIAVWAARVAWFAAGSAVALLAALLSGVL